MVEPLAPTNTAEVRNRLSLFQGRWVSLPRDLPKGTQIAYSPRGEQVRGAS